MKMDEKEIAAELAKKYGMQAVEVKMDDESIKKYLEKIKNSSCLSVIQEEAKIEMIDDERVGKLKEIALELLSKYKKSGENVIWEYSGNIQEDTDNLMEEVEKYRERIEEVTRW
mgnify:CR=1 FL=1